MTAHSQLEVRYLNIVTNDLAYDSFSQRIYASIPAANGPNGNSLGVIDPKTHTLTQTVFIGSDPAEIAVSDDGEYVYSGFNGSNTIRRIKLSNLLPEPAFTLGSGSFGVFYAEDIEVMPGNHNIIAVSRKMTTTSPRHAGVAIFENGVMRSVVTQSHTGSNRIAFSNNANWLFGYNNESTEFGLRRLVVDSTGVKEVGVFQNVIGGFSTDFIHHNNKLYSTSGKAVDVSNAPYVEGQFFTMYSGAVTFDPGLNLVCYAVYDWQGNIGFRRFNPEKFLTVDSISISATGYVKTMVNCGPGCYAFNTSDNKVVLITPGQVGLQEHAIPNKPVLFPNPTSGFLYLQGISANNITVIDSYGRQMPINIQPGNCLDLSALSKGVYFIQSCNYQGLREVYKIIRD